MWRNEEGTPCLRDSSATLIARKFAPRVRVCDSRDAKSLSLRARIASLPWHDKKRGEKSMLSLSEAAKSVGVAKSTIWRSIKCGRISASRTVTGTYQVDAAELFRVFPAIEVNGAVKQVATPRERPETAALEAQLTALKDIGCLLREQLEDLRKDRDAWRGQAESNQRLLVDDRQRRGFLAWLIRH
jgi:hypothetical protein